MEYHHKVEPLIMGSLLEGAPGITYVQSKFDFKSSQEWLQQHWFLPVVSSFIYVTFLWFGRKWMADRPAFNLRGTLVCWNVGLALFSMLGMLSMGPNLLHSIIKYGIHYTVCHSGTLDDPQQAVWGFLFVVSKLFEFGDTVFIVLRKSPLQFLHWYHHITVCMYSWYGLSNSTSPIGHWFGVMNFTVHTFMYSYYALKAARVRVPSYISQIITVMQISQMFVALYINIMNFVLSRQVGNESCECNEKVFKAGLVIYGSYAILFLKFFYDRYCIKKPKRD